MELIKIFTDIVVAIAAVFTSTIAYKGVNSWRNEVQGRADFEVARNLLAATYKLRDEIGFCRSPFIRANEFPEGFVTLSNGNQSMESYEGYAHVYSNRWRPVVEALQRFDSVALEGEVLWGEKCHEATDAFRGCLVELNSAIEAVIDDKASHGENFKSDKDFAKRMRDIVSSSGGEKNEFSNAVNSAVQKIVAQVRPHLRHS
jgi:hypothetical protein